jgi:hypothetical protein
MEPNLKSPPRKPPKKRELAAWIEHTAPRQIGEPEWQALLSLLAPVSESYLRRLLRESGVPLAPLVEGVRQESFDALESSLLRLLAEYEQGDAAASSRVRRLVIAAKDHARFAARKEDQHPKKEPGGKEEMALWMLTWLENPPVFPEWVRLRRAALEAESRIAMGGN